jgi:hypothetical protein
MRPLGGFVFSQTYFGAICIAGSRRRRENRGDRVEETIMGPRAWDGVEDFGTLDIEITDDWALLAHWTPAQRALKIELDGERRQARQLAESTGRLVSRLVAIMVAEDQVLEPGLAA